MKNDWSLKLDVEPVEDIENEISSAANYWATQKAQGFTYENYSLFHVTLIGRLISCLGYKNVVEIGCGSGRNIKSLNATSDLNFESIKGFDFNQKFVEFGREKFELDLDCEDILEADFGDSGRESTACFSVSVLDHIVDIDALVAGMANKFGLIVLLEPAAEKEGENKLLKLKSISINSENTESQPFTYIHKYREMFSSNSFDELIDTPIWPSAWGSGSAYRLKVYSNDKSINKDNLRNVLSLLINKAVNDERAAWRKLLNVNKRKGQASADELLKFKMNGEEKAKNLESKINSLELRLLEDKEKINELKRSLDHKRQESDVLYKLVKRLYQK
jgi:SAM-dependent methyltransferase